MTVDLGANGGKHTWRTADEAKAWYSAEEKQWEWLHTARMEHPNSERVRRLRQQIHQQFEQELQQARQHEGHSDASRHGQSLVATIQRAYSSSSANPLVHSSSAEGQFLLSLQKENQRIAAHALAFVMNMLDGSRPQEAEEGIFRTLLFRHGFKDRMEGEAHALAKLHAEWSAHIDGAKNEHRSLTARQSEGMTAADKTRQESKDAFASFLADSAKANEDERKKHATKMGELERVYNEKMALHSSITYWKTKATSHKKLSFWFGGFAFFGFLLVGASLAVMIWHYVGNAKLLEVEFWKLSTLAIFATVGVWFLRVMVRLLLSNIHLYTDATERRTMLLTYLALLREQKGPKDDERTLILQALFRPSSTGIVKDDAAPPFMAEWLKRTTDPE